LLEVSAKNYENWLTVDKIIAITENAVFGGPEYTDFYNMRQMQEKRE